MKSLATKLILIFGLNALAAESKAYCNAELGQVVSKFREVYDGYSLRASAGYKFTDNLGVEVAYEFSPGGTARDNFWTDIGVPTDFAMSTWSAFLVLPNGTYTPISRSFSKIGTARGTVDYKTLDRNATPNSGTLTKTNLVVVLGFAVPIKANDDFTFTVKEKMSANFFGLGDSLDSTTVSVGMRLRF